MAIFVLQRNKHSFSFQKRETKKLTNVSIRSKYFLFNCSRQQTGFQMSLNNIEFPGFIIADLFKNHLVAGKIQAERIPAEKPGIKFLGGNKKHIAMLVQYPDAVFLPEKNLQFITKMLDACRLNIGDVAIINYAKTGVNISELKNQLSPQSLVMFGIEPMTIKLPLSFPQFKTQAYDGCTFLYSPSIEELDQATTESKLLKSRLWICLRKLFEI
jgi:hypothetical protein